MLIGRVAGSQGHFPFAGIYAFNKDREFYAFMRSMQAYKNSLKNDTTVILTEKSDFLKYLNKSR